MRALPVLVLLAALLAPTAGAAAIELVGGKIVERPLEPGADHEFRIDVVARDAGALYAKLLPTPQNAVHDGTRSNGSVEDGEGWRVTFAFERADGSREALGTFADGTLTRLVPVASEERVTFIATTHVPASARDGGPVQRVYVVVAHRATATSVGSASGASMDDARAITLLHSNATLPPASSTGETTPTGETTSNGPDESTLPPVGEIDDDGATYVTIHETRVPPWLLPGGAVLVGSLVAIVVWQARAIRRIDRALAERVLPPTTPSAAPRQVPVQVEAGEPTEGPEAR